MANRPRLFAILLTSSALILCAYMVAQGQVIAGPTTRGPDLTGTWSLKTPWPYEDHVMVISRTGDVITIADSFTHNKERVSAIYNLYTDGRGEINRIPFPDAYPMFTVPYSYDRDTTADPIEIKSKTSEEKGKLVRRGAYTYIRRGASKLVRESYTFIQEYRLTSKGRKLAISTLRNGVPQAFAVFQRKD